MNRITNSQDGIPRLTLKLETCLSAYDLAVHLICRFKYEIEMDTHFRVGETFEQRDLRIENFLKSKLASMSSKQILDEVAESILNDGTENPHYHVSDQGYSEAVSFLTGYLTRKYKGFQKVMTKDQAMDEIAKITQEIEKGK